MMPQSQFPPFLYSAEGQMQLPPAKLLARTISKYSLSAVLRAAAGMMTLPAFQANSYRLEMLAHIAISNCEGSRNVGWKELTDWLNGRLGGQIAAMEDPPEDVFVSNVATGAGDYLIIGGTWEASNSSTALLFDVLEKFGGERQKEWLVSPRELLRLSERMLSRCGLRRNETGQTLPKKNFILGPNADFSGWSARAAMSLEELVEAGIDEKQLAPFFLPPEEFKVLASQSNQESALHMRPLVRLNDEVILALPGAVAYAVRRHVVRSVAGAGQVYKLQQLLAQYVTGLAADSISRASRHEVSEIQIPPALDNVGVGGSLAFRVGQSRFIHLLVVEDDLQPFAELGTLWPLEVASDNRTAIPDYLEQVRTNIKAKYPVKRGLTFFVAGHLGQAFIFEGHRREAGWSLVSCRLEDLQILLKQEDGALEKLFLLHEQLEDVRLTGLEFPNTNGILNLYAYWVQQGYQLRPADVPRSRPAYLQIATDFLTKMRIEYRTKFDKHCEINAWNRVVSVVRTGSDSLYASTKAVPAYVNVEALRRGILTFCLKTPTSNIWVTVVNAKGDSYVEHAAFKLWEALQLLIHRALLNRRVPMDFQWPAVEVVIDFDKVTQVKTVLADKCKYQDLSFHLHRSRPIVKIIAERDFLERFGGIENDGERYFLANLFAALWMLADAPKLFEECEKDSEFVLRGRDAKVLHAFTTYFPLDHLLSGDTRRIFHRPHEQVGAVLRSVFAWMPPLEKSKSLNVKDSCMALNAAVSSLVDRISQKLRTLDRTKVVAELLHCHETLLRDKKRWRATARAVQALYAEDAVEKAQIVEQERSEGTLTLRALAEAALCECCVAGGNTPDPYLIDELYGLMGALLQLGRDSEAIYKGLSSSGIVVYPGGGYEFSADILEEIGTQYVQDSFASNFARSAEGYEDWVNPSKPKTTNVLSENVLEYAAAFHAEYGLAFTAFQDIFGALGDIAVKRGNVVCTVTTDDVLEAGKSRNISREDLRIFFQGFGLSPRETWTPMPPGAYPKDIEPWRFERRLSIMLRPLLQCGSPAEHIFLFGAGTLWEAFRYIVDSSISGAFDKDVFVSKEMRSYVGRRVDQLGREFSQEVASTLRRLGWMAETEVKMTRLGAPKNPNLGDIDVLAWSPTGGILAIECKRLKPVRSITEIAQTCDRFRGNAGDHLFKHLRRMDWIKNNFAKVVAFTKADVKLDELRTPLITSAVVPIRYLKGLPLSREHIIPLEEVALYAKIGTIQ
ncbi:MAG: hypothetical protein ACKVOO_03055 [Burkholderiaceae bacterium]